MNSRLISLLILLLSVVTASANPHESVQVEVKEAVFLVSDYAHGLRVYCDVTNVGDSRLGSVTVVCRFLRPDGTEYSSDTVTLKSLLKGQPQEAVFYAENDAAKKPQSIGMGSFGENKKAPPLDEEFRQLRPVVEVR